VEDEINAHYKNKIYEINEFQKFLNSKYKTGYKYKNFWKIINIKKKIINK